MEKATLKPTLTQIRLVRVGGLLSPTYATAAVQFQRTTPHGMGESLVVVGYSFLNFMPTPSPKFRSLLEEAERLPIVAIGDHIQRHERISLQEVVRMTNDPSWDDSPNKSDENIDKPSSDAQPGPPTENDKLRQRSGNLTLDSRLVSFLYQIMRDHIPVGRVEKAVWESMQPEITYSNGWLAQYAKDVAKRLQPETEIEESSPDPRRPSLVKDSVSSDTTS